MPIKFIRPLLYFLKIHKFIFFYFKKEFHPYFIISLFGFEIKGKLGLILLQVTKF